MSKVFLWSLRVAWGVLLLFFALQNTQTVELIAWDHFRWPIPLALLLGCSFGIGFLSGMLVLLPTVFSNRKHKAPHDVNLQDNHLNQL